MEKSGAATQMLSSQNKEGLTSGLHYLPTPFTNLGIGKDCLFIPLSEVYVSTIYQKKIIL